MNLTLTLLILVAQDAKALDASLDEMAAATTAAAYTTARAKVLAMGDGVVALLKDRATFTAAGWVRACAAEACRLRLTNAELVAAIDAPTGLDPAVYGQFRKPQPLCLRDFVHRGTDSVPLLIERWRWTMSDFPFSAGDAGTKEREVFQRAILDTPGQVNDARAQWFLASVVSDGTLAADLRAAAAGSLGAVGGAKTTITTVLDDDRQPLSVREGCALGLGRYADAAALDIIRSRLTVLNQDPAVVRALLGALGTLGSAWAWESRGAQAKVLADEVRKGCAETLVTWMKDKPAEAEIITRGLLMVAWPASVESLKAISGDAALKAAAQLESSLKRK